MLVRSGAITRFVQGVSILTGLSALVAGCARDEAPSGSSTNNEAQITAEEVLEKAFAGLGGREALAGLHGFSVRAVRERYMLGQGPEAGIGLHRTTTSDARVVHDLVNKRSRLDLDHDDNYRDRREVTELIVGQAGFAMGLDNAYIQKAPSNAAMRPERWAANVKTERLLNPHILLREALRDPTLVSLDVGKDSGIKGHRLSAEQIYPITVERLRLTGKRTLVTNEKWLGRWQGTDFFDRAIQAFEIDSGWLKRWQESARLQAPHHRLVLEDDVYPITLYVHADTGRISKLVTMEHDMVYGDVALEVSYHDWQSFDGVYFPTRIEMLFAGSPNLQVLRSELVVNPSVEAATFGAPQGVTYEHDSALAARGKRLSQTIQTYCHYGVCWAEVVGRPRIESRELQPGVHQLTDIPTDAVYVLVVEQTDGLVVIEPGHFDLKGEAIIDWAKQRFQNKPITHVVGTHSHTDHTSGIRPYVAAGATVVAHQTAREYYAALCERPKATILPDALDRNPRPATVVGVPAGGSYRIDDAARPVGVYSVATGHATDMVIAVVENEGILYAGDLNVTVVARLSKEGKTKPVGGELDQFSVELVETIRANDLAISTLIGSHDSTPVPIGDFRVYVE